MADKEYKGVWIETLGSGYESSRCAWCRNKPPSYMIGIDTMISSQRISICDSCGVMIQLFMEKTESKVNLKVDLETGLPYPVTNDIKKHLARLPGTTSGRIRSDRPNRANMPRSMPTEIQTDTLFFGDTLLISPKNSTDMFYEYDDGTAEADQLVEAIRTGPSTVVCRFPLDIRIIRKV